MSSSRPPPTHPPRRGAAPPAPRPVAVETEPPHPRAGPSCCRLRGPLLRYGFALALVALVTLLRLPLASVLGGSVPFILYFPAIVVAGWFGGVGPGLAASLASAACAVAWVLPVPDTSELHDAGGSFRLLLFVASGVLISFLCGQLHRRTADLENERDRLEANVRERTLHLERALGDMEAFSYTVSHDLRSPIRSVHGYSELLLERHGGALGTEGLDYLHRIQGAVERLDRLINDLLAFAKVSGQRAELRPLVLRGILERVLDHALGSLSATANFAIEGCDETVLAHETLLHQVFQNLLENAAKFVAPGVRPEVRVHSETRGARVRVWIVDNGVGIDPATQARLFKPFERGHAQQFSGTGIGLATVDRAMTKMNGSAGVESQVGQGSRFWIELPRA